MNKRLFRSLSAFALVAAAFASGCATVDQPTPSEPRAEAEYITGSRLPRRNGENYQGTRGVSRKDFEEDKARGGNPLRAPGS